MCRFLQLNFFPLLYMLLTMKLGITIKIHDLRVPEITKQGASVILDCDYSLEETDHKGLVVKWFFNQEPYPVYQWIPGSKMAPQGLGILKDKLNLDYKASDNENMMHRALHILKPSAELSGEYTCVVSSFHNEDKQTKKMVVFVPEKSFQLQKIRGSRGITKVLCVAERVYPQPNMAILMQHSELQSKEEVRKDKTGLFDISAVANLPEDALIEPKEFSCELRVPAANYTTRREAIYYPGSNGVGGREVQIQKMTFLVILFLKWVPLLNG